MRMLITGGAGFIGSHLCEKYTKEGHTVLCLDNFMSGNLANIRHLLDYSNFKLVNGDIRDFDLLIQIKLTKSYCKPYYYSHFSNIQSFFFSTA